MSEKKAPGKPAKGTPKADGESAVLAKIAEMAQPDRAISERLHAIIKASAPALSPTDPQESIAALSAGGAPTMSA
jgi:hypothetical protein